jgi:hypothetical protein
MSLPGDARGVRCGYDAPLAVHRDFCVSGAQERIGHSSPLPIADGTQQHPRGRNSLDASLIDGLVYQPRRFLGVASVVSRLS